MSRYLDRLTVKNHIINEHLKYLQGELLALKSKLPADTSAFVAVEDLFVMVEAEKKLIRKATKKTERDKEKLQKQAVELKQEIELLKEESSQKDQRMQKLLYDSELMASNLRHLENKMKERNEVFSSNQILRVVVEHRTSRAALDAINNLVNDHQRDFEMILQGAQKFEVPQVCSFVRDRSLSKDEWESSFDGKGRIVDSNAIKARIFFGGVAPEIRPSVWKYLLNYYSWDSTAEERIKLTEHKGQQYMNLKHIWKNFTPDQEKNFLDYCKRKEQIHKDVIRIDTQNPFLCEEETIEIFQSILLSHCFYNWDLGYVQGMHTFLTTIIQNFSDETDIFWCFAGSMQYAGENFSLDQSSLYNRLLQLAKLIAFFHPQLFHHLQEVEATHMLFAYRWILVHFIDIFGPQKIVGLWEVFWTNYLGKDFYLFFAAAILIQNANIIIERNMQFDEIMHYLQTVGVHQIELEFTLNLSIEMFYSLDKKSKKIKRIIFG